MKADIQPNVFNFPLL